MDRLSQKNKYQLVMGSKHLVQALMIIVSTLFLSGCFYNDDTPPISATGKQMYEDYCAGCHKANGLGKFVMGIPATFSNQLSREEIIKLILKGDPRYPRMPTFPQIRFSQADKIAQYLSQLEQEQQ